jgi:hypothetical protein
MLASPPRYCPTTYEECGKHLAISILDLTESNPWSRLPGSTSTSLEGVRQWIELYIKTEEKEMAAKSAKMAILFLAAMRRANTIRPSTGPTQYDQAYPLG